MMHPQIRGQLRTHVPLAQHTSWRIGGTADNFFVPADLADLRAFLGQLPASEPLFFLGLGSNVLIRDGGWRGTVILTYGGLQTIEQQNKNHWRMEAGVACSKVARLTKQQGFSAAEFLIGIPGTLGGALAMNAGAFGGEIWPLVQSVETIDRFGQLHHRLPCDFVIGYRSVKPLFLGEYFVAAHLSLPQTHAPINIKTLLTQRKASQPLGLPSCGSVFQNPPPWVHNGQTTPRYAAQLIESCGLKGRRIGDAYVSPKHANFIINGGQARACEVEALMALIIDTVERQHGVRLRPEVRIVGEPSD